MAIIAINNLLAYSVCEVEATPEELYMRQTLLLVNCRKEVLQLSSLNPVGVL